MPNTYTLISSVTVGSGGAATINFSSIPSTYTDLVLKTSFRGLNAATYIDVDFAFNGSTSSMSRRFLYAAGGAAASGADSLSRFAYTDGANATASAFSNSEIYIPNYAGSAYKSVSSDVATESNGATDALLLFCAGLWSNTAAINQITMNPNVNNFAQYSTAYLYGIKNS